MNFKLNLDDLLPRALWFMCGAMQVIPVLVIYKISSLSWIDKAVSEGLYALSTMLILLVLCGAWITFSAIIMVLRDDIKNINKALINNGRN